MNIAQHRFGALSLLIMALCTAAAPAAANDAALENCRLEKAADKRLACYDAIALGTRAVPAAVSAAAAATTAAPTAAAAPATAAGSTFGFVRAPSAPDSIESSITGPFEGWEPKTQITLANGQVWAIDDGSTASLRLNNPKVRVRSGMMSSFYLVVEGTNRSPRVKRLN